MRRTEAGIQALAGAECLTVEVNDRFGSYGLTGVMIFRIETAALVVDTFLLSCRALGRGVEHRMVARLGEIAKEQGLERVEIPFVPGQRNQPAWLFLNSLASPGDDRVFRLPAGAAAGVRYQVGRDRELPVPPERVYVGKKNGSQSRRLNYAKIATDLRDPAAILDRIRAVSRRASSGRAASDPPRTPRERDLMELCAGLLNLPAVGIHDNFFELGGHSLLAVQLLSRVRQIYGVELSLEVVYSGEFTVAELAKAVELKEIEQSGADYQDLLNELEGLSDAEVRALLAQEQEIE
jgi:acyl carrier protein